MTTLKPKELQKVREFIEQFSRLDQYDMGLLTEAEYYRLETPANVTPSVNIPAWGLAFMLETVNADEDEKNHVVDDHTPCYCCFNQIPNDYSEKRWVHVVEGGLYAVHALFQNKYEGDPCDMYFFPICDDCLNKFPQYAFVAQTIDPVATLTLGDFIEVDKWPSDPDPLYPDEPESALDYDMEMKFIAWQLENEVAL